MIIRTHKSGMKASDLHRELFSAMKFERIGALFVLSLIIVVACFNLITTLILVSAQKIRQIGILQVMGCSKKVIKSMGEKCKISIFHKN